MENFFYDDKFYSDLESLMSDFDFEEDHLEDIPDDWEIECKESDLEPIFKLSSQWITERIDEERFREDGDEIEVIDSILNKNIDYDRVNQLIPKLYYSSRRKFKITKQDIVDECK